MILLNITILADSDIHEALKSWIQKDFLTSTKKEGLFESLSLLKVLNSPNEGVTYALQFKAVDENVINQFRENQLISFQNTLQTDYPNKVYFFESLMEYLAE